MGTVKRRAVRSRNVNGFDKKTVFAASNLIKSHSPKFTLSISKLECLYLARMYVPV
jgi:hypothetical protein